MSNECPICLEKLEEAVETKCCHIFCKDCLISWQDKEPGHPAHHCPVCRSAIPNVQQAIEFLRRTDFSAEQIKDEDIVDDIENDTQIVSSMNYIRLPSEEDITDVEGISRPCKEKFRGSGLVCSLFIIAGFLVWIFEELSWHSQ